MGARHNDCSTRDQQSRGTIEGQCSCSKTAAAVQASAYPAHHAPAPPALPPTCANAMLLHQPNELSLGQVVWRGGLALVQLHICMGGSSAHTAGFLLSSRMSAGRAGSSGGKDLESRPTHRRSIPLQLCRRAPAMGTASPRCSGGSGAFCTAAHGMMACSGGRCACVQGCQGWLMPRCTLPQAALR